MAFNLRTGQGSSYTLRTGLSSVNDLDASNITTGIIDVNRLPSIDKTKVSNTGTWETSEIPELSKTKIADAGVWDTTEIPELPKTKIADAGTWDTTDIHS